MTARSLTLLALAASLLQAACGDSPCESHQPGSVCAVAGTGETAFNADGLPPLDTHLYLVSVARRAPDGLLYIMDFNNMRLRRIEADGLIATVAGNGFHGFAATGIPATDSPMENPIDFDFLPDGRIALVSYHDPRVLVLDTDNTLRSLAGTGDEGIEGNEGDGGPALFARFIQLDGIAVAADGTIYISDSKANRVRMIRESIVTTVAGTGEAAYSGDGGPATAAALNWPTALDVDAAGNLYIADTRNHVVRRLGTDGVIETVAGSGTSGLSGDGGSALAAQLKEPNGVAIAADGTLYIADRSNFRVRRVAPDGIIETIAGTERGYAGDDGPALEAEFGYLARVSLDGDSLLVADQSNSCIRSIILP